jgi:hypothetical protein
MARIRSVHPGLFKDEAFMELSMSARVLLIGIWTIADDHGVFEWKPKAIRAEVFPADNVEMDALLEELASQKCVVRFEDTSRAYAVVRNFCLYQRPREPSYRHPFPQAIHSVAGIDRRKAEDLVKADGRKAPTGKTNFDSNATAPPQDSSRTTEILSHRRGEKGKGRGEDKSKTETSKPERESLPAKAEAPSAAPPGSLSEATAKVLKEVEPKSSLLGMSIGTELPETWVPDEDLMAEVIREFGMAEHEVKAETYAFHAHHAAQGSFSANWPASFKTWCKRWKEHRDKTAPPRVQVSNAAPKRPEEFTEAEWEAQVIRFAKNASLWTTRHFGPEPGMTGCKCPRAILEKHGIDPATGMRRRAA